MLRPDPSSLQAFEVDHEEGDVCGADAGDARSLTQGSWLYGVQFFSCFF
jgi:hypothetical protein